jgi:hypothetical protein
MGSGGFGEGSPEEAGKFQQQEIDELKQRIRELEQSAKSDKKPSRKARADARKDKKQARQAEARAKRDEKKARRAKPGPRQEKKEARRAAASTKKEAKKAQRAEARQAPTQTGRKYSDVLWDYLGDMPYMPSYRDREQLTEKKRIQLWDYFFRIKPSDVGKPQQQEIAALNAEIEQLQKRIKRKKTSRVIFGVVILVGAILAAIVAAAVDAGEAAGYIGGGGGGLGVLFLLSAILMGAKERRAIKKHLRRIEVLEEEIAALVKQIPPPPDDEQVCRWLEEDLDGLEENSIRATGLGTRLVEIRFESVRGEVRQAPNPLIVRGPGELQDPDRMPPVFKKKENQEHFYSPDRAKHLRARRAVFSPQRGLQVLYGVYYLEHILVADDMLATHGCFFDFITGKSTGEATTEQYYKDVVSLATLKDFRTIELSEEGESFKIEDAPTFSLSLASGEIRKVTLVNEGYFAGISKKLDLLSSEDAGNLQWVRDAQKVASNAIEALRAHLRKHKQL